mmetsp:Transcript_50393/g.155828  ORF Transcript_50393/g.155828 Transcript_50393/m.155828 type:complete len:266 (+) Transcript_50393:703-1500(+)
MLVLALEIQVHWMSDLLLQRCPRGARVEPHVHRVGALLVQVRLGPKVRWQQVLYGQLPPSVGPLLGDDALDVSDDLRREQSLAAVLPVEGWNGHTPGPLPRNAPVAAPHDHGPHAVGIALRDVPDFVHRLQRPLSQAIDACKPLRGCTRDDGLLAPPIVWVLVPVRSLREERAAGPEQLGDLPVGVGQDVRADERLHADLLGEVPLVVDWRGHLETILLTHFEVVCPVTRCGVDQPCSGVRGDVVATEDHWSQRAGEWVFILKSF